MTNVILQKEVRKYVKLWRLDGMVSKLLASMKEALVTRFAKGAKVEEGALGLKYSDVPTTSVKYKDVLDKIQDALKVDPSTDAERVFAMKLAKKVELWLMDASKESHRVTLAPIVGTLTEGTSKIIKGVTVKKDGSLSL